MIIFHSLVIILEILVQNLVSASDKGLFPLGGISLSSNGHHYQVTTQECPGGVFFPKPVNETCLCYNGIFSIVRDCCSEEEGLISTDTIEWRKNYQCGVSPEIGDTGPNPIRAILPLTKASRPFRPVLTLQEFSGQSFSKWRKFDLVRLLNASNPTVFANSPKVEIINVRALPKKIRFRIGNLGDVDICYTGWHPHRPQTLRISVLEYSAVTKNGEYCCFEIRKSNSPGTITSPCREGSIATEIVNIASVNKGNACPNQGISTARAMIMPKKRKTIRKSHVPKNLKRFKRFTSSSSSSENTENPSEDDSSGSKDETSDNTEDVKMSEEKTYLDLKSKSDVINTDVEPEEKADVNEDDENTDIEKTDDEKTDDEKTDEENTDNENTDDEKTDVEATDNENTDVGTGTADDENTDIEKTDDENTDVKNSDDEESNVDPVEMFHLNPADSKLSYSLGELEEDDYATQFKKIRSFTMYRRQGLPEAKKEPTTQRFILLKKSLEIYSSVVPDKIVPKHFVEDAFEAFFYLYESLDIDDQRLDESQFQRTLDILMDCKEKLQPWGTNPELFYRNGSCPLELEELTITYPNGTKSSEITAPLPPDWLQFDKTKFDIFIDTSWKMVSFVHDICFEYFTDDYNAHHFYENQLEILFLHKFIQQQWNRSIDANDNYAKGIIKELNRDARMKELDKTLAIAHLMSRYTDYLRRPSKENLIPTSDLFRQVQRFEKAVASRLHAAKFGKRRYEFDTDDDDFDVIFSDTNDVQEEAPIAFDSGESVVDGLNDPDSDYAGIISEENGPFQDPAARHNSIVSSEENAPFNDHIPTAEIDDPEFSQENDVFKHDQEARKQFERALEENEEDPALVRSKKHIGNGYKSQKLSGPLAPSTTDKKPVRVKPGDSIWDGQAICLDARSNDNPAYYTQEELWGTKPSLTELGMKYPLKPISMQ